MSNNATILSTAPFNGEIFCAGFKHFNPLITNAWWGISKIHLANRLICSKHAVRFTPKQSRRIVYFPFSASCDSF